MKGNKSILIPWAFYDFAASSFAAIIQTFVFATYFVNFLSPNPEWGSSLWGFINGAAGIAIAILSPVLGAIADKAKRRKSFLIAFTLLSVLSTFALYFQGLAWSAVFLFLATIGAECAFVFYNSYLPDIAPHDQIGKWSGFGWAFGYLGGISSLILAFAIASYSVPLTFILAGAWYGIFSLPLILSLPPEHAVSSDWKEGVRQLGATLKKAKEFPSLFFFLLAHLAYIDALTTLFVFGGVFAASIYHLSYEKIILFGITLHVTSGLGSFLFSFFDDRLGSKRLIVASLLSLIASTSFILISDNIYHFTLATCFLGLFVGPLQSASRSYLAKLAPPNLRAEYFGLFAFSGKATAFLGPLLVGYLTYLFDSLRVGMIVIILFFLIGLILLKRVDEV